MIGLDTNILVRAFVQDDSAQFERVRRLLDEELQDEFAYLNAIVIVEFAWSMRRAYRWEHEWLHQALSELADHPRIVIEDRESYREAIALCRNRKTDFPDAYLGLRNAARGCRTTVTFDKNAAAMPTFTELGTT